MKEIWMNFLVMAYFCGVIGQLLGIILIIRLLKGK